MKEETFDLLYDALSPRLNLIGEIGIKDALDVSTLGYGTTVRVFSLIMETMVEQGKAKRLEGRNYYILKPNTKG